MSDDSKLLSYRERIDKLDTQLLELFNERAGIVHKVGDHKRARAESAYRPEREAQMLRSLAERSRGPLFGEQIVRLYRAVIDSSRALEPRIEVAALGPTGTWSQQALLNHFGHEVAQQLLGDIPEVFEVVSSGGASYGIVPVENSIEGAVSSTLDALRSHDLVIQSELSMDIDHLLLGAEGASIVAAERVCGHPQALAQCRRGLTRNCAGLQQVAVGSNAEAARMAAEDPAVLALAGPLAREAYNLIELANGMASRADNSTRFLVVGREPIPPCGDDKTSLCIEIDHHRPGALLALLQPFAEAGVNLSFITTRPTSGSRWSYVFFIDCTGHQEDAGLQSVFEVLEALPVQVKRLGSYPREISHA